MIRWSGLKTWQKALVAVAGWEAGWWLVRRNRRYNLWLEAYLRSHVLHKPLVVVGAPDRGATSGYPPGDVTIDIGPSTSPNFLQADISKPLPFADNSVVAFVACVLEYVDDYDASMAELKRIAGDNLYICRVDPWTLTAYLYPGTKRRLAAPVAPLPLPPPQLEQK